MKNRHTQATFRFFCHVPLPSTSGNCRFYASGCLFSASTVAIFECLAAINLLHRIVSFVHQLFCYSLPHHRNPGSCSFRYIAKQLFQYGPAATTSTTVAQCTGPGEAGSKIFPNFQTANAIFFNGISNFMTFLFIDIIH